MKIQPLSLAERILGWVAFVVLILVLAGMLAILWPRMAVAAISFDCHDIAMLAGGAADFRDAGAEVEKTVRISRLRHGDRTAGELAVIEREVRAVFKEKKQRRQVIAETYRRCRSRRGAMD